ncbi:hypothetical protein HK100_006589 [Physocladia obscura]|uniref:Uncharacterized protein n=1 Tax=Physocladia obscura TaxID=109957 RepID=A0AAD5SVV9_9FUNG|nr:hypothetical protein HK100_006589 [Physocladia obscura]
MKSHRKPHALNKSENSKNYAESTISPLSIDMPFQASTKLIPRSVIHRIRAEGKRKLVSITNPASVQKIATPESLISKTKDTIVTKIAKKPKRKRRKSINPKSTGYPNTMNESVLPPPVLLSQQNHDGAAEGVESKQSEQEVTNISQLLTKKKRKRPIKNKKTSTPAVSDENRMNIDTNSSLNEEIQQTVQQLAKKIKCQKKKVDVDTSQLETLIVKNGIKVPSIEENSHNMNKKNIQPTDSNGATSELEYAAIVMGKFSSVQPIQLLESEKIVNFNVHVCKERSVKEYIVAKTGESHEEEFKDVTDNVVANSKKVQFMLPFKFRRSTNIKSKSKKPKVNWREYRAAAAAAKRDRLKESVLGNSSNKLLSQLQVLDLEDIELIQWNLRDQLTKIRDLDYLAQWRHGKYHINIWDSKASDIERVYYDVKALELIYGNDDSENSKQIKHLVRFFLTDTSPPIREIFPAIDTSEKEETISPALLQLLDIQKDKICSTLIESSVNTLNQGKVVRNEIFSSWEMVKTWSSERIGGGSISDFIKQREQFSAFKL